MSTTAPAPDVRVVVLEDRTLYRDALAHLLGRVPGVVVVAAVARTSELPAADDYDTVVIGGGAEQDGDAGARAVAVHRHGTAAALTAAVLGLEPAAAQARPTRTPGATRLTPRETEVLRSTSAGASAREIAAELALSPRTVERHKRAVLAKLGAQNQAEGVTRALALGLLPGSGSAIRVATALVNPLLAELLCAALGEHGVEVIGGAGDADALHEFCVRNRPDVVLLAAALTEPDTVEATIRSSLALGIRSVLLLPHEDRESATRLLLAGASGVVALDDADVAAVAGAIRTVAAGAAALHPDVVNLVLAQWRQMQESGSPGGKGAVPAAPAEADSPVALSERELSVLGAFAEGLTNRQVARQLGITEKTVEAHKTRIYGKLRARNQAHAVQIASSRGLLVTSQNQRSAAEATDR